MEQQPDVGHTGGCARNDMLGAAQCVFVCSGRSPCTATRGCRHGKHACIWEAGRGAVGRERFCKATRHEIPGHRTCPGLPRRGLNLSAKVRGERGPLGKKRTNSPAGARKPTKIIPMAPSMQGATIPTTMFVSCSRRTAGYPAGWWSPVDCLFG